jgi:hypothetical protein
MHPTVAQLGLPLGDALAPVLAVVLSHGAVESEEYNWGGEIAQRTGGIKVYGGSSDRKLPTLRLTRFGALILERLRGSGLDVPDAQDGSAPGG